MKAGSKWIIPLWIAFFVATNWPVLWVVNRIEPRIGPFPFLVAWLMVWSIGIGILHLWYGLCCLQDPKIPERDAVVAVPPSPFAGDAAEEDA